MQCMLRSILTSKICINETCRNSLTRTVRYIVNVTQALRRKSSPHHTTTNPTITQVKPYVSRHIMSCKRQFMVNKQQASPKSSHLTHDMT